MLTKVHLTRHPRKCGQGADFTSSLILMNIVTKYSKEIPQVGLIVVLN